jgi:hypothetical protein
MASETYDVVVVGAGSGSIIGWKLALQGHRVAIVDRDPPGSVRAGSTFLNHRIKHSGAMQSDVASATRLWRAFSSMDPLEHVHMRSTGGFFLVPRSDVDDTVARWTSAGIPFGRREPGIPDLPVTRADTDVFTTPDGVIDYPGLVRQALRRAVAAGARIVGGAVRASLVRDGARVTGVLVDGGGSASELIGSRHCVVAAGAWAPELLEPIGVAVPVERWRTHILVLPGELVPRLTVLTGPPLLVLVPFGDTTLAGDARRTHAGGGGDRAADPASVEGLRDDTAAAFAGRHAGAIARGHVVVGVKTEVPGHGSRAQDIALFGEAEHGVGGLTVAFPGKASLMVAMANRVMARLDTRPGLRVGHGPAP